MNDSGQFSLNMFAKCPDSGNPKTRLQPPLTRGQAKQLHIQLAERTMRVLRKVNDAELLLWLDQPSQHGWVLEQQQAGCRCKTQRGATLGERMYYAFEYCLAHRPVAVLVGSDCPVISTEHVVAAKESLLSGNDAVFHPSDDGGYALIGLSRNDMALFSNVDWGSDKVMQKTRHNMAELGWQWTELETLWDVDTPSDMARLEHEGIELPSVDYV